MKVLSINAGSSSIKYSLFEMEKHTKIAAGLLERIGEPTGLLKHKIFKPDTTEPTLIKKETKIEDHKQGISLIIETLTDPTDGVIRDTSEICAVGHRVVHGGEHFWEPAIIDDEIIEIIKSNIPLAPVHNPANLTGIEAAQHYFENIPQVAIFDTAFHHGLPRKAFQYALPMELYEKHRVRRYGFHGTSFSYVAKEAAAMLGKPLSECNFIAMHLGNGTSMSAIKNGKGVDTTMGLTPLEGLVMGTRCGDIDPAIHYFLATNLDMSIKEIDSMLNRQSGLKGLCGTNDMRDTEDKREAGDECATIAFDVFCYRIRKYIGAFYAVLGNVDALIFTGGIGENSPEVRKATCSGLERLGITINSDLNAGPNTGSRAINNDGGDVKVLVIPTNEELEIARQVVDIITRD